MKKVMLKINRNESSSLSMYLDENEVWIQEASDRLTINCSYEERFNSLLSLFSLKNEWENTSLEKGNYEIFFQNNDNVERYCFIDEPSNFLMFMSYFSKLIGDNYD